MADTKDKGQEQGGIDTREERINSLTFDEKVIKKIAGLAASEIPGILAMSGNLIAGITDMLKSSDDPTKGISVEVGKKQVAVDMKVICEYGRNMPAVFQSIVDKVSGSIKEMTGLDVVEVNVHVSDVLTKEDFDRKKKVEVKPPVDIEVAPAADAPARVE